MCEQRCLQAPARLRRWHGARHQQWRLRHLRLLLQTRANLGASARRRAKRAARLLIEVTARAMCQLRGDLAPLSRCERARRWATWRPWQGVSLCTMTTPSWRWAALRRRRQGGQVHVKAQLLKAAVADSIIVMACVRSDLHSARPRANHCLFTTWFCPPSLGALLRPMPDHGDLISFFPVRDQHTCSQRACCNMLQHVVQQGGEVRCALLRCIGQSIAATTACCHWRMQVSSSGSTAVAPLQRRGFSVMHRSDEPVDCTATQYTQLQTRNLTALLLVLLRSRCAGRRDAQKWNERQNSGWPCCASNAKPCMLRDCCATCVLPQASRFKVRQVTLCSSVSPELRVSTKFGEIAFVA